MLTESQDSTQKLRAACLGLARGTEEIVALAEKTGLYQIAAIADSDYSNAERVAKIYNCAAFDDYRQLILQNDIEILIVAEPLYKCIEYVRLAIQKKCHIIKLAPTASNFEEAKNLVALAKKNKVKYITAKPAAFAPGFERLGDYLKTVDRKKYYFVNIFASFGNDFFGPIEPDKLGDPELSGGGVLLNDCFELFSLIIENFAMPNSIYTLLTNKNPDRKARQYFGEDTFNASVVFRNGLIGNFLAARHTGVGSVVPVRIYGAENNIAATPNRLAIYDNDGTLIGEHKYPLKPKKCITEMFIDIGRAILDSDLYKLRYSSRLDLETMALIESAYLSSRTAMPESPSKFLIAD